MDQLKWDKRFLELAKHISSWSKDPSTKCGSVLAKGKKFIALGYNNFASGVDDNIERYNNREIKYKLIVHAEQNAIINAGFEARGATMYVWPTFVLPPICSDCGKLAINAGIKEVVGYKVDENTELAKRWVESNRLSKMMFDEAGVNWRGIDE